MLTGGERDGEGGEEGQEQEEKGWRSAHGEVDGQEGSSWDKLAITHSCPRADYVFVLMNCATQS